MPKKVIKKDGRTELYIREKIVVSVVKTGAPIEVARKIADKIDKQPKEYIQTSWIRQQILDELELHNPDRSKSWYNYDEISKDYINTV